VDEAGDNMRVLQVTVAHVSGGSAGAIE